MGSIELGCLSCSKYSLVIPIHGRGDAPYYKCIDNKDPKECKACQHNANKGCAKGDGMTCGTWAESSDRAKQ